MRRPRATGFVQSVQDRLRNQARATGRPFAEVVELFTVERFLHRLGRSEQRERFVLKGAHLLRNWLGTYTRPTRDIDLLGPEGLDDERLRTDLAEILAADVEEDGLEFDLPSLAIHPIRHNSSVLGLRSKLDVYLGRIRIRSQVDVGMGDHLYPAPEPMTTSSLVDLPSASVRAYTPYSTVAEKLEAMFQLGMANTRMKDYYDILALSSALTFDGTTLAEAIRRTFSRRSTPIPPGIPDGLTDAFAQGDERRIRWSAFLRKSRLDPTDRNLGRVVERIRLFALPAMEALRTGRPFSRTWPPGGPWIS